MNSLLALASDPAAWAALLALIAMEVILGIDNLVFIAILSNKLPEHRRVRARQIGLTLALALRLLLLGSIAYIVTLTTPIMTIFGHGFSWRDLILIAGGLFLVWKSTKEIHHHVDPNPGPDMFGGGGPATLAFGSAMVQIILLDLVFSLDSIITAVGMTEHVPIMVIAVLVAVGTMLVAATPLSEFINRNPTIVMLALGFLLMIGTVLIAEGFGAHVPKGYVYAAMAFSVFVEMLNMLARNARQRGDKDSGASSQ
jgi:predicted tellurium resistance membrane protein TerC